MLKHLWCKKHRIGIIKIDIISYDERGYRTRQAKVAHAKLGRLGRMNKVRRATRDKRWTTITQHI
jgi:hypothetical protein